MVQDAVGLTDGAIDAVGLTDSAIDAVGLPIVQLMLSTVNRLCQM
jgi:hypothetical protein